MKNNPFELPEDRSGETMGDPLSGPGNDECHIGPDCLDPHPRKPTPSIAPAKNTTDLALAKRRMAYLRLFSVICPLERSGIKMLASEDAEKIDTAIDEFFSAHMALMTLRTTMRREPRLDMCECGHHKFCHRIDFPHPELYPDLLFCTGCDLFDPEGKCKCTEYRPSL